MNLQETLTSAVGTIFGGDTPQFHLSPLQVAARAAAVYIIGLAIVRLGKSRLISRATPLDVILGFILGSLLSRGITGHAAMSDTIVASAVLVAVHWLLTAAACRSPSVEKLIKGHAYALVERGRLLNQNMLHSHVSPADLEEAMRLEGVKDIAQVESAYKERNGEVSIIQRNA
jgi:uncharacterized membrane protein YcaP (DUF421 family)